jgi:signal transduction histidine kinase
MNISKYADVSEAYITMQEMNNQLCIEIYDEGAGFATTSRGNGVGLFSMEERARAVGGSLDIESSPGHGTRISLIVPL